MLSFFWSQFRYQVDATNNNDNSLKIWGQLNKIRHLLLFETVRKLRIQGKFATVVFLTSSTDTFFTFSGNRKVKAHLLNEQSSISEGYCRTITDGFRHFYHSTKEINGSCPFYWILNIRAHWAPPPRRQKYQSCNWDRRFYLKISLNFALASIFDSRRLYVAFLKLQQFIWNLKWPC